MSVAYLGLGSNVDARRHIAEAVQSLREQFGAVLLSPVYRNAAVGFTGSAFLNLAARINTRFQPMELRDYLRCLEQAHGRDRNAPKWSDRTLDIDILLYDELMAYDRNLEIPRREILKFAHVLKPLADIAPGLIHPLENLSYAELWGRGNWEGIELEVIDSGFLGPPGPVQAIPGSGNFD